MKQNFIRTSDKETISTLLKEGFTMVSKNGEFAIFVNDKPFTFDDKSKIQYTNMLTF